MSCCHTLHVHTERRTCVSRCCSILRSWRFDRVCALDPKSNQGQVLDGVGL